MATKIINAFAVSGADTLAIADAKTVNKKLQGTSSKKQPQKKQLQKTHQQQTAFQTSQQSYDRLIDHFANLIQVEQNSNYTPNETELQVATLQTKLSELQTKNTNLINAYTGYAVTQ